MYNEKKSQAQNSLLHQIMELRKLANKEGLYDAADWLDNQIVKHFKYMPKACRRYQRLGCDNVFGEPADPDSCFVCGMTENQH